MATPPLGAYETVVGLEVHAQLLTKTKAFCACATSFGDPPNTHVCPVCLGLPGALPVLNVEAVRMAVSTALALGCAVQERSIFARKNYFYPDLPKGYQISQYDRPLALRGALEIEFDESRAEGDRGAGKTVPDRPEAARTKKRIGITRVHMEEDAGKNIHGIAGQSVVDLNRAGTPLIEIVGEPDLRSGAEAAEYLKRLREILMFLAVNDGNLEQGSLRCDANVSVRKRGAPRYGTRVELKNINSFKFVAEAIDLEARRQVALLEQGDRVRQQTRGYNADKRETYLLRDKENDAGYRYFPEPDLPPLVVDDPFVGAVGRAMPELPIFVRRRLVDGFGITPAAASFVTSHPRIAAFFEETTRLFKGPVKIANFLQSEVMRDVSTSGLTASFPISPTQLAALMHLVDDGTISGKQAKDVYADLVGTDKMPGEIVRDRGMRVLTDTGELERIARGLLDENAKQAAAYRAGKTALLGFFVGQMMKKTGGSADPTIVNDVLKRLLDPEAPPPKPPKPFAKTVKSIAIPPSDTQEPSTPIRVVAPPEGFVPPPPLSESGAIVSMPRPDAIPMEAFTKLDLRVGLVVAARAVPDMPKLLEVDVDVADSTGPRRLVAELGRSYKPAELVGRRVLVICNMEARAFSIDLISRGMILAAGPSDALALVTVSKDLPPGTRVK